MTSNTQAVYERVRADLLACRLRPGDRLRINYLCRELSVSTGAVREALSRLTADGLVSLEPNRGFRAAPISIEELKDLTEVRMNIEEICTRRAFANADVAWEARVVAAFHRLSKTPLDNPDDPQRPSDAFAQAHQTFHEEVVSTCNSTWLLRIRELMFSQSQRYRAVAFALGPPGKDGRRDHRAIVDAVLASDVERAVAVIRAHISGTTNVVLDILKKDVSSDGERLSAGAHRARKPSPPSLPSGVA